MTDLGSSSDDFPLFADASPADRFSTGMVTETRVLEAPTHQSPMLLKQRLSDGPFVRFSWRENR